MAIAIEAPREVSTDRPDIRLHHFSTTYTTEIGKVLIQRTACLVRLSTFLFEDGFVKWDMIEKRDNEPPRPILSYKLETRFWKHLPNPCVDDVLENANRILNRHVRG